MELINIYYRTLCRVGKQCTGSRARMCGQMKRPLKPWVIPGPRSRAYLMMRRDDHIL